MSDEQERPEGAVTLDEILEAWNKIAPCFDGMAHSMRLDLDTAGDLGRARRTIGAFLQDCEQIGRIKAKQAARSPEDQKVIEEAGRELRKRAAAAGVEVKTVTGDSEPESAEEAAAEGDHGDAAAAS